MKHHRTAINFFDTDETLVYFQLIRHLMEREFCSKNTLTRRLSRSIPNNAPLFYTVPSVEKSSQEKTNNLQTSWF